MPTKKQTRAAKAPKSRTASRRCAVSTGSSRFAQARVVNQSTHFTIRKAVRMGQTSVAYFDNDLRADIVKKALNYWRRSKEGMAYYEALKNPRATNAKVRHGGETHE